MSAVGILENILFSLLKGTDEADVLSPPPNSLFLFLYTAVVLIDTDVILQTKGKGQ